MGDLRVSSAALRAKGPNSPFVVLEAILAKVSDAELQVKSSKERAALLRQLTPGQRMIFAITRLEMEVNGGGLDAYFRYPGGDSALDAFDGLQKVGATKFVKVLSGAIAMFPNGKPDPDTDKRAAQLDRIIEKKSDDLGRLSSAFLGAYDGEESLGKLLIKYVQAHPEEFFV